MSKVGKQPVTLPEKVSAEKQEGFMVIRGPLGELKVPEREGVGVEIKDGEIVLDLKKDKKQFRSNWGTLRSLIQNAVEGVTKGFEKNLQLEGVGFRIAAEGKDLNLTLGFSHPVIYKAPEGIEFEVDSKNLTIKIKGIEKSLVGQTAAEIRALKKPEPYKGKGFRYEGEVIRRKAGKKAVGTTE